MSLGRTFAGKVGLCCAFLHCVAFVLTVVYIRQSTDPQAPLVWAVFGIIDLPVSLLYFAFGDGYSHMLHNLSSRILSQMLYVPHVIHGLVAPIWWYFLPRLVMRRRFGGVWAER
jgi:hypothetical protein